MISTEKKDKFTRREYKDYPTYIRHQQEKLAKGINWLEKYDAAYRLSLYRRLCEMDISFAGKSVLCLGARTGTEVRAFIDMGGMAIGIDVNPGPGNQYVSYGDFHSLVFADNSSDVVFTNSLDHILYLDKFIFEIKRVLKDKGILILDILSHGMGPYESLSWNNDQDILEEFYQQGFQLLGERTFDGVTAIAEVCYQYVLRVRKNIVKDYELC